MHRLFRIFLMRAGEFCTPCNMLIDASCLRFARQNSIRSLMSGSSDRLSDARQGMTTSSYYDRKYYFNVLRDQITRRQVQDFVSPSYINKGLRRLIGVESATINPFNYLRPTLTEMHHTLERELNWKNPSEELEHGDCLLTPVKNYIMFRRWGCSAITTKCSAMIRDGQMTRQEALERAAKDEQKDQPEIFPEFLDALKITETSFIEALKKISEHFQI